jgi:hypothetical protein
LSRAVFPVIVSSMRFLIGFLIAGTRLASAQAIEPEAAAPVMLLGLDTDSTVYALSVVFVLTFILTFYVGVLYFRERRRIKAIKAAASEANPLLPALTETRDVLSDEDWRQRALIAEARAGSQAMLLREQLMPELTEFVKQSLVQGLAAQRDALLTMQQQAMQSLIEMESRLAALQAPMQDRIRAYETRITELEKDISAQGAEMREMTRTILKLMRQKLDEEQQSQETFH